MNSDLTQRCLFRQGWDSPYAINVAYTPVPAIDNADTGMSVSFVGCAISQASGGVGINNNKAVVNINGLDTNNATLVSLLATANGGVTDVEMLIVTMSSLGSVALTTSQGQLNVRSSMILDNTQLTDIFVGRETGTNLTIDSLEVLLNTRIIDEWNVIFVETGSTASLTNSSIGDNLNMASAVQASEMGMASISDTKIFSNNGVSTVVSVSFFRSTLHLRCLS